MHATVYPDHEFRPGRCERTGKPVYRCVDCGIPVAVFVRTGRKCLCVGFPVEAEVPEVVPGDVVTQYVRQQQEAR